MDRRMDILNIVKNASHLQRKTIVNCLFAFLISRRPLTVCGIMDYSLNCTTWVYDLTYFALL